MGSLLKVSCIYLALVALACLAEYAALSSVLPPQCLTWDNMVSYTPECRKAVALEHMGQTR
jgi:hypothetical protein